MTFRQWLQNSAQRVRTEPIHRAVRVSADTFIEGIHRRLGTTTRASPADGVNLFTKEWDVCLLLDACAPQVFRAVAREYPWLQPTGTQTSVAGYSKHWLEATFRDAPADAVAATAFAAWNPYTEHTETDYAQVCAGFDAVHEHDWDDDLGCVPPQAVLDAADALPAAERRLLWFQQPHAPYRTLLSEVETLSEDVIGNEGNERLTVWNLLRRGDVTRDEAVIACAENLRWVLDACEPWLAQLNAETDVFVTADHGELFGEGGRYGHPKTRYHDHQLQVPTARVDLARVGERPAYGTRDRVTETAADRLQALGYVD